MFPLLSEEGGLETFKIWRRPKLNVVLRREGTRTLEGRVGDRRREKGLMADEWGCRGFQFHQVLSRLKAQWASSDPRDGARLESGRFNLSPKRMC